MANAYINVNSDKCILQSDKCIRQSDRCILQNVNSDKCIRQSDRCILQNSDKCSFPKAGNAIIKEILRGIAYKFRAVARYQLRRILSTSSVSLSLIAVRLMYIDTNPANKRVRILKSKPDLLGMEQESVDILLSGTQL